MIEGGELGIREVAKRLDMTLRAIRFYEDKGLVKPRREGQRRIFDKKAFARLERIKVLAGGGVALRKIRMVLDMEDRGLHRAARIDVLRECDRIEAEIIESRAGLVALREKLISEEAAG